MLSVALVEGQTEARRGLIRRPGVYPRRMEAESAALAFYKYVEDHFGAPFDEDLIDQICESPARDILDMSVDVHAATHKIDWSLPPAEPSEIRPAFLSWKRYYRGASPEASHLLLLAETVIESSHRLNPFHFWSRDAFLFPNLVDATFEEAYDRQRQFLRSGLDWLLDNRGRVEAGSIQFVLPEWAIARAMWDAPGLLAGEIANERRGAVGSHIAYSSAAPEADLDSELAIAMLGMGTLTPVGKREADLLRATISGRTFRDRRVSQLSTLATIDFPYFSGSTKAMQRAQASDAYVEFRRSLRWALEQIEEIPEGQEAEAGALVVSLLREDLSRLEKAVRSSPALSSLRAGARSLAFVGLGAATAGLVTGTPLGALAGGASSKIAETSVAYLEALKARRSAKAVWDLVLSLDARR